MYKLRAEKLGAFQRPKQMILYSIFGALGYAQHIEPVVLLQEV